MKKFLVLVLVFAAFAAPLFAGGSQSSGEKVYVFASEVSYPPLEFIDENGDMVGFDIDLLAAIAEEAGFEYEVRNTAWDGIFAGLANNAYDAVISAVTITEDRAKTMNFSDPYINAGQILVVPIDGPDDGVLKDFEGKKVGTQQGTTGDFEVEKYPAIKRMAFDEVGLAIEDLVNGNLDAVVCDSTTAIDFVAQNENYKGKLKVIGEPFTEEYYGIAVNMGNTELLDMINAGLKEVIDSGKRDELIQKWFR